jgi:hypothetical protein
MKWMARSLGVTAIVTAALALAAPPALAKAAKGGGGSGPAGYDIGYPQCGQALPVSPAFGVVGVNNGIVFSANPCLGSGASSELAWAERATNQAPSFYANTANPGPAYSSHWPVGQTSPQPCAADAPNAPGCSYDYGWNAARDSFNDAVNAELQLHGSGFDGAGAAAQARWWLDVETSNSWETLESAYGQTSSAKENDTQALLGAVAALRSVAVSSVGVYSTGYQWTQVTGGTATTGSRFVANPSWVAGSSSATAAQRLCGTTGFTGGTVTLAQYPRGGFDGDLAC